MSEAEIRDFAEEMENSTENENLFELSGGQLSVKQCYAKERTIFIEYYLWGDVELNSRDNYIKDIYNTPQGRGIYAGEINLTMRYFKGDELKKEICVYWQDFSPYKWELGERINTREHAKAKGVEMHINAPFGWEILEGKGPNVVKRFEGDGGMYSVIVYDNLTFFSRRAARELLNDPNERESILAVHYNTFNDCKISDCSVVTVGTYPALEYTIRGWQERMGVKLSMVCKQWIVYFKSLVFASII